MKATNVFIISISLIILLFLSGCASTVVKYQCADGSFMDSAESCTQVNCQTNCPELDCNACPPKIEYQEKIVEKPIETIKYQFSRLHRNYRTGRIP